MDELDLRCEDERERERDLLLGCADDDRDRRPPERDDDRDLRCEDARALAGEMLPLSDPPALSLSPPKSDMVSDGSGDPMRRSEKRVTNATSTTRC